MSKPIVALALMAAIFMGAPVQAEFTPWATRVLYNRLAPGMTIKAVLNMIGSEPTKITEYTEIGSHYAVYQWINSDSSTMNVLFKDNQLQSKSAHLKPTPGATD